MGEWLKEYLHTKKHGKLPFQCEPQRKKWRIGVAGHGSCCYEANRSDQPLHCMQLGETEDCTIDCCRSQSAADP